MLQKVGSKHQTVSFTALDDDVLATICERLCKRSLISLSETSKSLRELCVPILFRHCHITNDRPVEYRFLPETLRRHVRSLYLNDECPDMLDQWDCYTETFQNTDTLRFATNRFVCGLYEGSNLRNVLSPMSGLHSITLGHARVTIHGISWTVLQSILSLPQLREFSLYSHHLAPGTPPEELRLEYSAPLISFGFILDDNRPRSTVFDPRESDKRAVSVILSSVHKTLKRLVLTAEAAPLRAICTTLDWPCLQELRLRGERLTSDDPIIAMFAHMTQLRVLELNFVEPKSPSEPQPIWPVGYRSVLPWPELQDLIISFPINADQIYDNLPATLRTLTLQCFPHIEMKTHIYRDNTLLRLLRSSSELLHILRRCNLPLLRGLKMEYREDAAENDLLCNLGLFFPTLRQLKVRRHHRWDLDATDVQVEPITCALRSLLQLSDLSLYLDNVGVPIVRQKHKFGPYYHTEEDLAIYEESFNQVANAVARGLGSMTPLKMFELLQPPSYLFGCPRWKVYRIDIEGDTPHAILMSNT
ncbi:hypothetical protein C2E23DRAFT_874989 [Lenzites betulinus]|nr:hypothetical protein C2E23DRAFT_874989 [Lenzites betulinus]